MPLLLLALLIGVLLFAWANRRHSTLTRNCRWRLDRAAGPGHWACAFCGATCDLPAGREPRDCLRGRVTAPAPARRTR